MLAYILRRLLEVIPTLLGVAVVVFLFIHALPGDPARLAAGPDATVQEVQLLRERFGLDKPLVVQFGYFLNNLARGNLGNSYRDGKPALLSVVNHFSLTFWLSLIAILLAALVGILVGIAAAVYRNSWLDLGATTLAVGGISVPSFFLGMILIYLFAVNLRIFPVSGGQGWRGLVLPALTLAAGPLGTIARFARSSLLEVLGEDFTRTARAKGLSSPVVVFKHALRNALIPVVTMTGLQFGFLLGGAVVVESVFNYPGLGWLLIQSISARDYPVIEGLLLVFALEFVLVNLLVDLLYGVLDPRISYA